MNQDTANEKTIIDPDMSILDVISKYRQTEAVFKRYEGKAGVCLCCHALFDPLKEVAHRYGLNLSELILDLKVAAEGG